MARQEIRSYGDITGLRKSPRDVSDVVVEPAIFVNNDDRRMASITFRTSEVGANGGPIRGLVLRLGGDESGIVRIYPSGISDSRFERVDQSGRGRQAPRNDSPSLDKFAPADNAAALFPDKILEVPSHDSSSSYRPKSVSIRC